MALVTIAAAALETYVARILAAAGCDEAEAARIGHHLLSANLAGHDSHGVLRVPRYVQWLREGKVRAGQTLTVVAETATHAVVDGNHGFGQTIGPLAVDIGITKARLTRSRCGRPAQRRASRADRRLGGARGAGGAGLDPFRERRHGRDRGALRRRGPALRHQPALHRRPARRRSAAAARLCDQPRCGRQGARCVPRWQAGAAGCPHRPGRHAQRRSRRALRPSRGHGDARSRQRRGCVAGVR